MILKENDNVSFLQFPKLLKFPNIQHGIFTRKSGASQGSFSSLNVSFAVGDDRRHVLQNRKIVAQCIEEGDLVFIDQVHGIRIVMFREDYETENPYFFDGLSGETVMETEKEAGEVFEAESGFPLIGDAVVTDIPRKNLVIQVADCQSVLVYEPVRQVVANIHAGWRGSINNIIGRTITAMQQNFGCNPRDIVAGISPSLGPCCAEFINYRKEIPASYWQYKDDKDHFDFWSASRDQLCDAGVIDDNIDTAGICTKCDTDNFFSFRGEGITGRFATVIGIK